MTGITDLPFEVLDHIVYYFEDVVTFARLALVCKRFNHYIKQDGFRAFVHKMYGFYHPPLGWTNAARFLTNLSEAWETKAFVARDLQTPLSGPDIVRLPAGRAEKSNNPHPQIQRQLGQSMGHQPVLDCFEDWTEGFRREVLAWGAGAELILRIQDVNFKGSMLSFGGSPTKNAQPTLPKSKMQWIGWKPLRALEGRDDITSVNLLRPHQTDHDGRHNIVVGRASGLLDLVTIDEGNANTITLETDHCAVRSADVNKATSPLLAACLEGNISLYNVTSNTPWEAVTKADIAHGSGDASVWTGKFLSDLRLGVGKGPSLDALEIFDITPDGLKLLASHSLAADQANSAYSLASLPRSSGEVFLTGWFSGHVSLQDLRVPESCVSTYEDPIDLSAVYSILPVDDNRFVAGGARHSILKVFDLRMANRSYNIFLSKDVRERSSRSPIYSLAAASAYSTTFFAGLEGHVIQMDLYSMANARARPTVRLPLLHRSTSTTNPTELAREVINLRMVEHTVQGMPRLFKQLGVNMRRRSFDLTVRDWDNRWVKDHPKESGSLRQGFPRRLRERP